MASFDGNQDNPIHHNPKEVENTNTNDDMDDNNIVVNKVVLVVVQDSNR